MEILIGWFVTVASGMFGGNEIHGVFESEEASDDYHKVIGETNHLCSFEREYIKKENGDIFLLEKIDEIIK